MIYQIKQLKLSGEPFADYQYQILLEGNVVANYWHDFRGDEHWMILANETEVHSPDGKMIEYIKGGGSEPLTLSEKAVNFLNIRLGRR
jgi:hypothetical protein